MSTEKQNPAAEVAETELPENSPAEATPTAVEPLRLNREELRAHILGQKPETEEINLFGALVEMRQPTLARIMEMRGQDQDAQATVFLTEFTFVPGTDELIFDSTDAEALLGLPFGKDLSNLLNTMNRLMGQDSGEVNAAVEAALKKDQE